MKRPRDLTLKQFARALERNRFHPIEIAAWSTTHPSGRPRTRRRLLAMALRERAKYATPE